MNRLFRQSATLLLSLGLATGIVLSQRQAEAAQQFTFIIGPLNRSISLAELKDLAANQKADGDLRTAINIAKRSPQEASQFLNQSFPFGLVQADRLLRSKPGEAILERLGKIVAPRHSNKVGDKALRAAILLSLSDDGKLTPLELLEKYPTNARINIDELLNARGDFSNLLQGLGGLGGR